MKKFSLFMVAISLAAGQVFAGGHKALPSDAAEEQVLRIATSSAGENSFIFTGLSGGGDHQNWQSFLWVPPMYFDENKELQPGVFTKWESNSEFTEWTFSIDPRAKFSDGSKLTAQDAKDTWEAMANPDSRNGRIVGYIGNVQGFEDAREKKTDTISGLIAEGSTLRVKLKNPDPIFHWRISTAHMNVVKGSQAKSGFDYWKPENNPAYSGPYVLSQYNPDQNTATFTPNDNWWMDEGPYLEKITFQFVNDGDTLAAMFQNEQIDLSMQQPSPILKKIMPDVFEPAPRIGFNSFWFNVSAAPTDDPMVRKALVMAIDPMEIYKAAFPKSQFESVMPRQFMDPNLQCYDDSIVYYDYDPEGAKAALAASSYGGPENLPKLRVTPRSTWPPLKRGMEYAMEQWRTVLGIQNVEFKDKPQNFGSDEAKVNVSRDDVAARFPDPAVYVFKGTHSTGPIASGSMMRAYKNEKIDILLDEAMMVEPSHPKRCALAHEAQRLFLNDWPMIILGKPLESINRRGYVKNVFSGPDIARHAPWKIYISK
ncbi:MAG: ABC transporter substrate-binding protein [Deltaproteobacteria bacterium]